MNKEDFRFCPKCKTNSIFIIENSKFVECQNLNCLARFSKKDYLAFLTFWEKLDHSLDEDFDKLVEHGKKLGFISPNTSELFHIDAVDYSWDSEHEIYRGGLYLKPELKDTEGKEPESWTEKKEKKDKKT